MPDRSLRLATGTPPADPGGEAALRSLTSALLDWLPRQRWFAGKGRPLTGLSLVAATEVLPCGAGGTAPGLLHLLVRTGPAAHPEDGGDCYQLLLGVRDVLPPELAPALIARPSSGPLRGRAVYEALGDPRLAGLLLERLRVPGTLGTLRFHRSGGATVPARPRPRPLGAEQSNTSVVFGDAAILKVFRRVEPGIHPELELTSALARHGCAQVPPPLAWFESTAPGPGAQEASGPRTLGVLQRYLPGSRDGWQLALRALEAGEDFTGAARALGRTTARVHAGLAEALPTATLSGARLERTAAG
ncbi:maltokinase N-terminal cap-like domain-containing protein, partial [Streptomyces albus]